MLDFVWKNRNLIMGWGGVIFSLVSFLVINTADSGMLESHYFSEKVCRLGHTDVEKNPSALKRNISTACESCHTESRQTLSNPVDFSPGSSVPADLPLEGGLLRCITCHYVHPFSNKFKPFSDFLLRRPGRGLAFCSACHNINSKGHEIFENAHRGSYRNTNWSRSLDGYTLQCMECHDDKVNEPLNYPFAGRWQHTTSSRKEHPVGVSFAGIAAKRPHKFTLPGALQKEIRFFDGKIGCGTCHSAYSKEKFMLVTNNAGSRLCLGCHNI